jgi:HSP20 family molecular chaperone IbpA
MQGQQLTTRDPAAVEETKHGPVFAPPVDIYENQSSIVLVADIPGVKEKHLNISLDKNVLTIEGKIHSSTDEPRPFALHEYNVGDYRRSFSLSAEIEQDKIKATVKDGVLKLVLPKSEKTRARTIPINVA